MILGRFISCMGLWGGSTGGGGRWRRRWGGSLWGRGGGGGRSQKPEFRSQKQTLTPTLSRRTGRGGELRTSNVDGSLRASAQIWDSRRLRASAVSVVRQSRTYGRLS